jgi:molybdopterin synthase catalytic subunit
MIRSIQVFAHLRDAMGAEAVTVDLPMDATVALLRQHIEQAYPSVTGLIRRSAVAINGEFALDSALLPDDAEIALLPPVSGGAAPA